MCSTCTTWCQFGKETFKNKIKKRTGETRRKENGLEATLGNTSPEGRAYRAKGRLQHAHLCPLSLRPGSLLCCAHLTVHCQEAGASSAGWWTFLPTRSAGCICPKAAGTDRSVNLPPVSFPPSPQSVSWPGGPVPSRPQTWPGSHVCQCPG